MPTATTRRASPAGGHGGGRHPVALPVHVVVLGSRRRHRAEGAETDGQLDGGQRQPRVRAAVEHGPGQVQAGGRRGHRIRPVGVHRLVAVGIGEGLVDVGRQRHGADPVEQAGDGRLVHAGAGPAAAVGDPRPTSTTGSVAGPQHRARREAPARTDEGGPLGRLAARRLRRATAAAPRLPRRCALRSRSRAGRTRVVLTTSRSPGPTSSGRSATVRWSTAPAGSRATRRRAASRGSTGRWAMACAGRS